MERARARLQRLVTELEASRARIVVPAPALAEFLVVAGDRGPDYIRVIDRQAVFRIEPFDTASAIEAAASTRIALSRGDKKSGRTDAVSPDGRCGAGRTTRGRMKGRRPLRGGMAEWLKAAVLKTVGRESVSWVRIPVPPPSFVCKWLKISA